MSAKLACYAVGVDVEYDDGAVELGRDMSRSSEDDIDHFVLCLKPGSHRSC